jgi:D-threo-aldose 1-dehydrogenase
MDPFQLRKLGTSEVRLPALGMGGAPFGNLFTVISDAEAEATMESAWDAGIRYYDTSPWYGRGMSEHRMGQVLRRKERSEVILSTKIGRIFRAPTDPVAYARSERDWPNGFQFQHHHDYSYDAVMRSYEDSLQRLGMNRIDVLIIHDLDRGNLGNEARVSAHFDVLATSGMRALQDLKSAGLIGAIGAGVNQLGTIPRFVEMVDVDFFLVALPYTLAEQPVLDHEFPLCEQRGIGLVIGGVFASGILATGPVPGAKYNYRDPTPEESARVGKIEEICRSHGVPLAAAALQFPLHHPLVASVIPGAFQPGHPVRNVETMKIPVPDSLWSDLKTAGLLRSDTPTP